MQLTHEQKILRKRILEISFQRNLSHIGSCLNAVDLINAVYKLKAKEDEFVLSNGHAGIALYTVLEKFGLLSKRAVQTLNIHPDRSKKNRISVSTGSLGQGLPIAVGMAIADKKRNVYCMISDGECAEGSVWESLRIVKENSLNNLKILVTANGWGAYDRINTNYLYKRLNSLGLRVAKVNGHDEKIIIKTLKDAKKENINIIFALTNSDQFSFLKGQDAHYYVMTNYDYENAIKELK